VGEGGSTSVAAEAPVAPPPEMGAQSATSTLKAESSTATGSVVAPSAEGKPTANTKSGAGNKARAKPKSSDWFTDTFGPW
jgi:hypothetical protein